MSYRGRDEITRDPIFLLQRAVIVVADEGFFDEVEKIAEDGELSVGEQLALVESGYAALEWLTESVWFTREEAEGFRKAKVHRWPLGSRIYCICAEGELAQILKREDQKREGNHGVEKLEPNIQRDSG